MDRVFPSWNLVPVSLCLKAQFQLGHPPAEFVQFPTLSGKKPSPDLPYTAHQQRSRVEQTDQGSGRNREFLAAKKGESQTSSMKIDLMGTVPKGGSRTMAVGTGQDLGRTRQSLQNQNRGLVPLPSSPRPFL